MKKNNVQQKGFTIIEVVLVLAIAGLIFLIVFLAVPALQRSQRDTQRRNDVGRFVAQINQYQANNNGNVPTNSTTLSKFVDDYLDVGDDVFADPTTDSYNIQFRTVGSDTIAIGDMLYYKKAKCGSGVAATASGDRTVAVITRLEGAGTYCQDNL